MINYIHVSLQTLLCANLSTDYPLPIYNWLNVNYTCHANYHCDKKTKIISLQKNLPILADTGA